MIVCCGEALIDMIPAMTAAGEPAFVPHAGGAVFNTARALGRLGTPVAFFSGISTDTFGDQLAKALAGSNVDLAFVRFSDRPSTLAFVHLRDGQATYNFYDENSAGRMLVEEDLPVFSASVEALHFSCISLIPEPCGATYESLMRRESAQRVTMLDPNIRPGFIADKQKHVGRMRRMIAMADIVKLSDEDLGWFGESGSDDEIAARWLDAGPQVVVLTRGARGAIGYTRTDRIDVPARKVEVVDTVGAGDTFNAGLLAAFRDLGVLSKPALQALDAGSLRKALDFAMAAAAVTVSRAGANPPWRNELD